MAEGGDSDGTGLPLVARTRVWRLPLFWRKWKMAKPEATPSIQCTGVVFAAIAVDARTDEWLCHPAG